MAAVALHASPVVIIAVSLALFCQVSAVAATRHVSAQAGALQPGGGGGGQRHVGLHLSKLVSANSRRIAISLL